MPVFSTSNGATPNSARISRGTPMPTSAHDTANRTRRTDIVNGARPDTVPDGNAPGPPPLPCLYAAEQVALTLVPVAR
jgi:hypothetical protein